MLSSKKSSSRPSSARSSNKTSHNGSRCPTPTPKAPYRFFMGQKQFSIYEAMEKALTGRGDWVVERNVKSITRCDVVLGDRFDIPYSMLRTSIYAHAREEPPLVNYFKGSHRLTLKASMAKFLRDVPDIDHIMPRTYVVGQGATQIESRPSSAAAGKSRLKERATANNATSLRQRMLKRSSAAASPSSNSVDEIDQLRQEMERHPEKIFIAKPSAGCKGAGIIVTKSFKDIATLVHGEASSTTPSSSRPATPPPPVSDDAKVATADDAKASSGGGGGIYAVQEYIDNPFLIDGRKFDIRIWALVSSPFNIYIFDQGSCRTASAPYNLETLADPLAHLTNHGLQEESEHFGKFEEGNELWYSALDKHIKAKFGGKRNFEKDVRPKLNDVVRKCLFAARELLEVPESERFRCFQLFGFDLMLTDDLEVKLVEINGSPGSADRWLAPMVEGMIDCVIDPKFPPNEAAAEVKNRVFGDLLDESKQPDHEIGRWVKVWSVGDEPPFLRPETSSDMSPEGSTSFEIVLSKPKTSATRHADPSAM